MRFTVEPQQPCDWHRVNAPAEECTCPARPVLRVASMVAACAVCGTLCDAWPVTYRADRSAEGT